MNMDQAGQAIRAGVVAGTGYQAHKQGKGLLESASIGFWWAWWYRNATLSLVLTAATCIVSLSGNWPWWGPVQFAINLFVLSVTYVSLIDISGFKQRLWYKLWAPIQHAMPNVSRIWWYTLIFLPAWGLIWWNFYTDVRPVR